MKKKVLWATVRKEGEFFIDDGIFLTRREAEECLRTMPKGSRIDRLENTKEGMAKMDQEYFIHGFKSFLDLNGIDHPDGV
jgi:hypothetical protein